MLFKYNKTSFYTAKIILETRSFPPPALLAKNANDYYLCLKMNIGVVCSDRAFS